MAAINVLCGSNAAEHVQDYTAPTQSVAHLCNPWKDGFLRHTAALWMPPIIFVPPDRTNEQGLGADNTSNYSLYLCPEGE